MNYFVIQDGGPVPRALVRVDGHREQKLAGTGEWADCAVLAAPEPGWTVTQVESHTFYDHVYEAMREARAGLPCVAVSSTTYLIDEFVNVTAVMRRRDGVEEWLGRENVWQAADPGGEVRLPISEEELERLQWIATRPSWFVVRETNGRVHAVVRKIPSAEEAYTRDLRWEPSDLLGREDLRIEEVHRAETALEQIELEVYRERNRGPDETEYFTVEGRSYYPRDVFCVIRRTSAGEEVHAGASGWVPSELLAEVEQGWHVFYRHRAVSAEEAGAVIAARSGRRSFLLLDAPGELPLPLAVVRVDGEREEAFTRDLAWGPSTLLTRTAEQPGVRVEEIPPAFEVSRLFMMSTRIRHERQGSEWPHDGHWYFAFFTSQAAALDLTNVLWLHRTEAGRTGIGDDYHGDGGWRSTRWALEDYDRGKRDEEYLPVSPDEARRLMKLLDAR
ncbi:hypothetical protein [Lentzea pudingi]|uniref:hypothetical protein n=1 Tax=Lentzea pudingi TaxID=1789439 RepID=UPI00166ECAA1|nr:hypothetical protein [Lentzea pudingi]